MHMYQTSKTFVSMPHTRIGVAHVRAEEAYNTDRKIGCTKQEREAADRAVNTGIGGRGESNLDRERRAI